MLDSSLQARPEVEKEEMLQTLGVALLCVNSTQDDRPTMKDVAAMLKEIRQERDQEYLKVDVLLNANGKQDITTTNSSSTMMPNSYHDQQSNNTSFSASSLLYSSSSISKPR